jgi:hypothetical protein
MPKSCIVCSAVASLDLQLQYCAQCQSALYCSETCQRKDWKEQHKKICKLLIVGHGGMQIRTEQHKKQKATLEEAFERNTNTLNEGDKRFFKLFEESTFEGSQATAQKMKKYAKRQTKLNQKFLLLHSLHVIVRSSNSEMLSWPNSPLLVMLHFFDPSVLLGDGGARETPLYILADLTDPFEYATQKNQLILAEQLIKHGVNVKSVSTPRGETPLHMACHWVNVTNLDFVELLLEAGADPNTKSSQDLTPLMNTIPNAPGAAKFLLNWPTTDVNITARSGISFLAGVRQVITTLSDKSALPDNSEQIQDQFLLQQWRDIEEMLVERG